MEWIKCSDRLPENSDQVLCFFEIHGITLGSYYKSRGAFFLKSDHEMYYDVNEGWEADFTWLLCGKCTHWMPLPNEPKDD